MGVHRRGSRARFRLRWQAGGPFRLVPPACLLLIVQLGPAASALQGAEDTGVISGRVASRLTVSAPAVVHVERTPGISFPPPSEPAVMDQQNLVFIPHVLPVLAGTTVDFPNSDSVRHSVFTSRKSAQQFNLGTYPAGEVKTEVMDSPGRTTLLCNVHAEMSAYILVVETPYFATTDRRGQFVIENVPEGEHRLTVWHEKLKPQTLEVVVRANETTEVTFENLKRQ